MLKIRYAALILTILWACGDGKEETSNRSSPRIRKSTKVVLPAQNETIIRNSEVKILVEGTDADVDSLEVTVDNEATVFVSNTGAITLPTQRVGSWRLLIKAFSEGSSETHYRKVIVLPENAPENYEVSVQNTYPHATTDYTQGLLISDGVLFESTGQKGSSTIQKKNLTTGEVLKLVNLPANLFGEGLALYNDELYQLTWTSGQGFVYNKELEQQRTFNYQVEGWGLTTLNDRLLLTDETEKLYFVDPASFTIEREIEVYDDSGKIEAINELELIDGMVYANIYQEDEIVVIDPETGEVTKRIDCSGLLTPQEAAQADVLNGIAQDPATGKIYITGKWWPKLFEVTFEPKTTQ